MYTYRFFFLLDIFKPLHPELYTNDPSTFILPAFLQAINGNTEESITSIMMEPAPGVFAFPMLKPSFCQMLMSEVCDYIAAWNIILDISCSIILLLIVDTS